MDVLVSDFGVSEWKTGSTTSKPIYAKKDIYLQIAEESNNFQVDIR
jgi:hypothetical protein